MTTDDDRAARGIEELGKLIEHFGLDVVLAYMRHVQDNAEESVRRVIDALDYGGNDRHQYYETVASGSGAGDGFAGESVVQTHMTNSRLTDPEVLEWRFPVLVEEFSIRRGSGGAGRWRGGDGRR